MKKFKGVFKSMAVVLMVSLCINSYTIAKSEMQSFEFMFDENNRITFKDIGKSYWAKDYIETLAGQGIINGKSNNYFYPDENIKRSEFTKIVVDLLGLKYDEKFSNPFEDVQNNAWYYQHVMRAVKGGIISGKTPELFYPDDSITRQEVFTVIYNMVMKYCLDADGKELTKATNNAISGYKDVGEISEYAKDAINTLFKYGIVSGYPDDTLKPKKIMTRAEAAAITYKVAKTFRTKEKIEYIPPVIVPEYIVPDNIASENVEKVNGRYQLQQSDKDNLIWTDYPSERVFKDSAVPSEKKSAIEVALAKNEFEPFQIIVKPTNGNKVNFKVENSNKDLSVQIYKVEYVNIKKATDNLGRTGLYPDPLYPVETGVDISIEKNNNNPFWFTVYANKNIEAGDYNINVIANNIKIPVKIHVFNFMIPQELHVDSQMNVSMENILNKYGVEGTGENYWKYVDSFKKFFIEHRLTPSSVLWSGGLTSRGGDPYINYNGATGEFSDPHGIWGFEYPADRYLAGNINTKNQYLDKGPFNDGVGFPSFMAITFRNNDASADQRPSTFEGIKRSSDDWYKANQPNSNYNKKWFKYMADIEKYLEKKGYLNKAYYYFANEPQDQEAYDAVAWYSQELKKAAPRLRLMVSEEPKPEIYNNQKYKGAKIDQWLAVLHKYNPEVSWDREKNHKEDTWIYFLHGTRPPYFNPITLDHPGIESKLTGWFLWKYRIKGIAYYSINDWSGNVWEDTMVSGQNGDTFMLYPPGKDNTPIKYGQTNHRYVSSIRFELMRDSLEDYEYLYVLNGNKQPEVGKNTISDTEVDKIIYGLTSYNRDSGFMYSLRRYIGMKIANEINQIPQIEDTNKHERAKGKPLNYYINFQDPKGEPKANPLVVNNKEYMKIGWNQYNEELGYGWFGDMANVKYAYLSDGPDVLSRSVIYDDWGREKVFEFDLPNGKYMVTVSCGWAGRNYKRNKITIEGVDFINDEAANPYLVRTKQIEIKDNKLTMEMGIFDEYTMLNYLNIEAVN